MSEPVTDVLTRAGLSREMAQMVVAAFTMAQALADIQQQQQAAAPATADIVSEGGDAP